MAGGVAAGRGALVVPRAGVTGDGAGERRRDGRDVAGGERAAVVNVAAAISSVPAQPLWS